MPLPQRRRLRRKKVKKKVDRSEWAIGLSLTSKTRQHALSVTSRPPLPVIKHYNNMYCYLSTTNMYIHTFPSSLVNCCRVQKPYLPIVCVSVLLLLLIFILASAKIYNMIHATNYVNFGIITLSVIIIIVFNNCVMRERVLTLHPSQECTP